MIAPELNRRPFEIRLPRGISPSAAFSSSSRGTSSCGRSLEELPRDLWRQPDRCGTRCLLRPTPALRDHQQWPLPELPHDLRRSRHPRVAPRNMGPESTLKDAQFFGFRPLPSAWRILPDPLHSAQPAMRQNPRSRWDCQRARLLPNCRVLPWPLLAPAIPRFLSYSYNEDSV